VSRYQSKQDFRLTFPGAGDITLRSAIQLKIVRTETSQNVAASSMETVITSASDAGCEETESGGAGGMIAHAEGAIFSCFLLWRF
jgi:hypothetical protein